MPRTLNPTPISLNDFLTQFSLNLQDKPSLADLQSDYNLIKSALARGGDVTLALVLQQYLPDFQIDVIDKSFKILYGTLEMLQGLKDKEAVSYKVRIARILALKIYLQKLMQIEENAFSVWHSSYSQIKAVMKNKAGRAPLKPVSPSQAAIYVGMRKLNQKVEAIASGLNDYVLSGPPRANPENQYMAKSGGTDTETEQPWHLSGGVLQPKTVELTNQIWPKSKMLLSIVSKMDKKGLINKTERGKLKDMILDSFMLTDNSKMLWNNSPVLNILREYDTTGDQDKLYADFLKLART